MQPDDFYDCLKNDLKINKIFVIIKLVYYAHSVLEVKFMDIVKIGIIGCGGIATAKHMPSLKKLPNVRMVAFCDIIEERAQKAKREIILQKGKRF